MGVPDPKGNWRLGVEPAGQNLHLLTYDSPGSSTDQRFCLLSNDFDQLLILWTQCSIDVAKSCGIAKRSLGIGTLTVG